MVLSEDAAVATENLAKNTADIADPPIKACVERPHVLPTCSEAISITSLALLPPPTSLAVDADVEEDLQNTTDVTANLLVKVCAERQLVVPTC